ncbi:hypothetical protein AZ012_001003 [Citrobacter amalonaticus]|nr:hypothetical protein AZ012_001003 [Citrobacter amalonaticus]
MKHNVSIRHFIIVNKMINMMVSCLKFPRWDMKNSAYYIDFIFVKQLTLRRNSFKAHSD